MAKKIMKFDDWLMLVGTVGILNWLLVGIGYFLDTNLNLVNLLFGGWPVVENLIYIGVGLSGVSAAWYLIKKIMR